jgi:hypothetical protein
MKKLHFGAVIITASFSLTIASCTSIYTSAGHAGEGIPYYLPQAVIIVKEPIEHSRIDTLYAVLQLEGTVNVLYEFKGSLTDGTDELEKFFGKNKSDLTLIAAPTDALTKIKETTKNSQKKELRSGENQGELNETLNETSEEYMALSAPSAQAARSYIPADVTKSFEVVFVPDRDAKHMLHIKPGLFVGKVSATISDGWSLTSIAGEMDASSALTAITSIATGLITAGKDVDVAKVNQEGAAELERIKQASAASVGNAQSTSGAKDQSKVHVLIVGYVIKSNISVIKPGIYPMNDVANFKFATNDVVSWSRLVL